MGRITDNRYKTNIEAKIIISSTVQMSPQMKLRQKIKRPKISPNNKSLLCSFFLHTHSVTLATLARFFTQMETQPVISTQPPSALSVQSITVH